MTKETKPRKKCVHGTRKNYCIPCGGASMCLLHKKEKRCCVECKGVAICDHQKLKRYCVDCNGTSMCIHGKERRVCVECDGVSLCTHKIQKRYCAECGGTSLCAAHGKRKTNCAICDPTLLCDHEKWKRSCVDCMGASICEHKTQKHICITCKGSAICTHKKRKEFCKECGGKGLCSNSFCETTKNKRCRGFCTRCFVLQFPNEALSKNYKTKEIVVVELFKQTFPSFTWVFDKQVSDGCSRFRPDSYVDFGSHILIVEIDEHKHENYECSCENKRMMTISQDFGHRPIIFLRFNPDAYTDIDGVKHLSCFGYDKSGITVLKKKTLQDWNMRTTVLLEQVTYWSTNIPGKVLEVIQLFY
jgi:hypothetical protein